MNIANNLRNTILQDKYSTILWIHEYLSQPDDTLLTRIPHIKELNEIALVMASEQDQVVLSTPFNTTYHHWLRNNNLSTDNIQIVPVPKNTPITQAITKNPSSIQTRKNNSSIIVPRFCSQEDINAAAALNIPILGCESSIVNTLYDKAEFKELCKTTNIPVIDGQAVDIAEVTEQEFKNILSKYIAKTGAAMIKSLSQSSGAGITDSSKVAFKDLQGRVLIEEKHPLEKEYNIQGIMDEQYQFKLIAVSTQIVNGFSHSGNKFLNVHTLDQKIEEQITNIERLMKSAMYKGYLGLDLLETKDRNIYFCEVNTRLNGSTAPVQIINATENKHGPLQHAEYIKIKTNPTTFYNLKEILGEDIFSTNKKYGVFPMDITPIKYTGVFHALITAKTQQEMNELKNRLSNAGLTL